ncbi:hypothetical protein [Saccharothrix algeriensis]|uniref:Excalibur calcium-binding domain-containing protein n=1 Tax=Saccharothrix algeriensis TaxID=173560 RepID=A0A8T8HS26_9PSEU|nr:hypothetical protein [Saccharothrix algeriensis]MBM7812495.1 hypothetical protein [Saccharothrix algeriensis]QTR01227.1 hypothetical protein J7S33_17265 [Saccharothrix algeriensis]
MAGVLVLGASLAMVLTMGGPRPVDVRRVDLAPAPPGELSATHTTTIGIHQSTTAVLAPPPPPPPAQQVATGTATSADPPPGPPQVTTTPAAPGRPSAPPTRPRPDHCDRNYATDGGCVPWLLPLGVRQACEWLREHGLTRIEVRGRDRHRLDPDRDGIACEPDEDRPRRGRGRS